MGRLSDCGIALSIDSFVFINVLFVVLLFFSNGSQRSLSVDTSDRHRYGTQLR